MASNVVKRTALARPFFRMDTLAGVMPICSASSPTPILRLAIMTSRLMRIVISNHLLEFAPEPDKENSFHTATNAASMQNRNSTPIMRYGQCIDVWLG